MKGLFGALAISLALSFSGCATQMPDPKHQWFTFPKDAYSGIPKRKYETKGVVRSSVDFLTLDPAHNEQLLCRNYFNKAVHQLLKYAKDNGADAVIDVKSVTLQMDGQIEMHEGPECSDEGSEGQVLTRGIAVKWLPEDPPAKSSLKPTSK